MTSIAIGWSSGGAADHTIWWRMGGEVVAVPIEDYVLVALVGFCKAAILESSRAIALVQLGTAGKLLGDILLGAERALVLEDHLKECSGHFLRFEVPLLSPIGELPWEWFTLPAWKEPLLVDERFRGRVEFLRICGISRRRQALSDSLSIKCLAAWCDVTGAFHVEREIRDLHKRFADKPRIRFRVAANPSLEELCGRISLGCDVFLFAGHGQILNGGYGLDVSGQIVPIETILTPLSFSAARLVILDSCWSASLIGIAILLMEVRNIQYAIGIQGRGTDFTLARFTPELVDRIIHGQPVAQALATLRSGIMLNQPGSWFEYVLFQKKHSPKTLPA